MDQTVLAVALLLAATFSIGLLSGCGLHTGRWWGRSRARCTLGTYTVLLSVFGAVQMVRDDDSGWRNYLRRRSNSTASRSISGLQLLLLSV